MKSTKILIPKRTDGAGLQRSPTPTVTTGSLYVHVPFCKKKCPYCHFFVQPPKDIALYIDGIKREWAFRKDALSDFVSIYLGGGTPSHLSLDELSQILSLFPPAKEVTIEANPDDLTLEVLQGYRDLGINRISIGVQSLDDANLKVIGRTHSANKAEAGVRLAHQAGFDNISIDLMYDLPTQTIQTWKKTVDKAATLPISHLSIYNLIFEEGSSYYKSKPLVPPEEESLQMLEYAIERFEANGLHRYEISAFCRNNKESLHNTGYWLGRPFIGLGPSAFSYLDGSRFQNVCHLKKWHGALVEDRDPADFCEILPYPQSLHELLAVRLRLMRGTPLDGLPPETLATLARLTHEGYLESTPTHTHLSEKGKLFYDHVASEIV